MVGECDEDVTATEAAKAEGGALGTIRAAVQMIGRLPKV